MTAPLLSVRNLTAAFGRARVVEDVGFDLAPGEILGVVGESGSGKSITALSILRLVPSPGRVSGSIAFAGSAPPRASMLSASTASMARHAICVASSHARRRPSRRSPGMPQ